MTEHGKTGAGGSAPTPDSKAKGVSAKEAKKPDWANGLKQFYDSVVDEPLPDELSQLLARFDEDEA